MTLQQKLDSWYESGSHKKWEAILSDPVTAEALSIVAELGGSSISCHPKGEDPLVFNALLNKTREGHATALTQLRSLAEIKTKPPKLKPFSRKEDELPA
jgi:hypothetical protein